MRVASFTWPHVIFKMSSVFLLMFEHMGLSRPGIEAGQMEPFIAKFLQFQPKVLQKLFSCRRFDYIVVVFFKIWLCSTEIRL